MIDTKLHRMNAVRVSALFSAAAVLVAAVLFSPVTAAAQPEGIVVTKSTHGVKETMNRFEAMVKKDAVIVFARIDHAAGAAKVGKTLRPTELLIFGHPAGGTPFMECAQTVGIDLPLKALVWVDASSQVWVGYTDAVWIAKRHGVESCPVVPSISKMLEGPIRDFVGGAYHER